MLNICRLHTLSGKRCVILRPDIDTRANEQNGVYTHARGLEESDVEVIRIDTYESRLEFINEYDVIGIDEGQFMPNLDSIVKDLIKRNKIIIIAALNSKNNNTMWPSIASIIPFCNKIKLRNSICSSCKELTATTTKLRPVHNGDNNCRNSSFIGGEEKYIVLCLHCRYNT